MALKIETYCGKLPSKPMPRVGCGVYGAQSRERREGEAALGKSFLSRHRHDDSLENGIDLDV